jgi:uncharacterized lipoprotein YbaY
LSLLEAAAVALSYGLVVHGTIWLVLAIALARFAAAQVALLDVLYADGEMRTFASHATDY